MKPLSISVLLILISFISKGQNFGADWPVLKKYDQDHIDKIAMPVGGIGTGTVSLNGRGGLQDWEIMNRPAKGFNPSLEAKGPPTLRGPFFALYVENNQQKQSLLLEGPLSEADYEGKRGAIATNHGLARFNSATFQSAYPFGQVLLSDENIPVDVVVGAFNPIIPGNVDDSSIPMVFLNYEVRNTGNTDVTIAIAGTVQNFIGFDGKRGEPNNNLISYREDGDLRGLHYTTNGVDKTSEQWGTMSLVCLGEGELTYRTDWKKMISFGNRTLDFWDDFSADGLLEERPSSGLNAPIGSLALKTVLQPGEVKNIPFLLTWHFPNRQTWDKPGNQKLIKATVGNYYTSQYTDSWDVVRKTVPRLQELEKETKTFVNALIKSDLPEVIKEASLFNLSHFRTQLAFRIKSGHLMGWEGTFENHGFCFGSCTHVWNYEQTTPFLFGELAKTMRDVEYGYSTHDNGFMSFRSYLPLDSAKLWPLAAADGQMGCVMKFYRDWQLSGDDEFLRKHWTNIKKSLEFCWIPGGWDADKDGVMEGAQHNTMDVEYFGPNPQMGFWYLGALKAASEMATYLGDTKFAQTCRNLFENGSEWIDRNLFNGEYYKQDIRPPMVKENVAEGLMDELQRSTSDLTSPDYQLGEGVLVDQLVGQLFAHVAGLGYLGKEANAKKTLESIMKYNYRESMMKHNNFMRSFATGNESALLMAAYPGERPEVPFPYFTEVMTGFEYTAAIGMLYEGQYKNGLKCIQNIRDRYDGKKRNPFNEAEAGNHYARSMVAWAGIMATTGFQYSAVTASMSFYPTNGKHFWSNGYQYGTVEVRDKGNDKSVKLTVLNGDLSLKSFSLKGFGELQFKRSKTFKKGIETEFIVLKD